mmetsp:Transcript_876/g.1997  ORF Transcript_876/g.1997 Transcript_876/m.1997 type:complete len:332 (-) Transcript_876:29-1024(-)
MTTLLERLGGDDTVEKFVDDFYDRMRRDEDINKTFSKFGNFDRLKSRTVDYLVGEWGGTPYVGQDLFASHTQVNVTKKNYDYMMRCIGESLKAMKVSSKLYKEVVDSIEAMREPITDPDEKFKKWAMEKLAKLESEAKAKQGDMVMTAMGFTITREKYEQQQRELAAKEERAKKLAEMRASRESGTGAKKGEKSKKGAEAPSEASPTPGASPRSELEVSPRSPAATTADAKSSARKERKERKREGQSLEVLKAADDTAESKKAEPVKTVGVEARKEVLAKPLAMPGGLAVELVRTSSLPGDVPSCLDFLDVAKPLRPAAESGAKVRVRLAL